MGTSRLRFCQTDFPISGTIGVVASRLRYLLALPLLLLAVVLLAWGLWPAGQNERTLILSPDNIQLVRLSSPLLLRLRTPRFARVGDPLAVQLQCIPQGEMGSAENTSLSVMARARLEMSDVEVRPAAAVSQPLLGDSLLFYWRITSRQTGEHQGRLWFHLETVSATEEGADQEQVLAVMPVEVKVSAFLGLTGAAARGTGAAVAFLAILLFFLPLLSAGPPRVASSARTQSP